MKVELEKLELGHSSLTDEIYAGIMLSNKLQWKHKHNVTNDFIACAISRWENKIERITAGDYEWEISVKKIK